MKLRGNAVGLVSAVVSPMLSSVLSPVLSPVVSPVLAATLSTVFCTALVALAPAPLLAATRAQHADLEACRAAIASVEAKRLEEPDVLRVASWNVMKYRRAEAGAMVASLASSADILALQEGLRNVVVDAPQLRHRHFAEGYLRKNEQSGVELRSRFPATLTCNLRFREPWLRTPKAVLAAYYGLGKEGLLVVTLHAINFTFWISDVRAQFEAVGVLLNAHGGPAIVMGDFNNWNGYRQAVIASFAERHGLRVASFDPDLRSRHLGVPVDGLLQRGFEPLYTEAVPTGASDHHPIVAVLRPLSKPMPEVDSHAADAARETGP